MDQQNGNGSISTRIENASTKQKLTPEVVKKVTERVYAMLLADLRLEEERQRRRGGRSQRSTGGW